MRVTVRFYSYFRDLTGIAEVTENLPDGSTLGDLLKEMATRFPRLATMQRSTLMAVGVDYQERAYVLKAGDEVALFPPVQGG
jgi:MoaD family protein